jgi:hypothetical protein
MERSRSTSRDGLVVVRYEEQRSAEGLGCWVPDADMASRPSMMWGAGGLVGCPEAAVGERDSSR